MKRKVFTVSLVILILGGFFTYDYVFNSRHRDISQEEAFIRLNAVQIFEEFQDDESGATQFYLDQTIEVSGKITDLENLSLTLDDVVYADLLNNTDDLRLTSEVVIKGRCVGYDDLLEQVKIDQALIIIK